MTKTDMIVELLKVTEYKKEELNSMLKSEIEVLYKELIIDTIEDIDVVFKTKKEDVIEEIIVDVDEDTLPHIKEEKFLDISTLGKSEIRRLRRIGKL